MELPVNFASEDLRKYEKHTGFSHYSIPRAKAYASLYEFLDANPGFVK
jgi:hypothetical protein